MRREPHRADRGAPHPDVVRAEADAVRPVRRGVRAGASPMRLDPDVGVPEAIDGNTNACRVSSKEDSVSSSEDTFSAVPGVE
jgi:hypothetical protein